MYTINELAEISGLSTRTLRSYLKRGLLQGEKIDGVWRFSNEQIGNFIIHPSVSLRMEAKRNSLVFDFMRDRYKRVNSMCVILDLPCDKGESDETDESDESNKAMQYFSDAVNRCEAGRNLKMMYSKSGDQARVILTGEEECVVRIMQEYYK